MNNYESNSLYHWGVKGMKWGVRRYQNYDGTLTAAGRRRLGIDTSDEEKKFSEGKKKMMIEANVAADYGAVGSGLRAASNISRSSSSAISKSSRNKKRDIVNKEDISEMSDKELQQAVNRMNLERQYKSLKADQINLGRDRVSEYLDIGGDVLAGLGSAALIFMAIHNFRK